jgi:hypothetical protein
MAQVVKHLPSKRKTLSSNPNMNKNKGWYEKEQLEKKYK